ncbi:MAG: arylesterase [Betaproteobacteria bacterium]|nr:arylesterase [Betaproteobacteria bacterium]
MKFRAVLLGGILLTALSCSKVPPLPPLDGGATVLAFGDSLTFGTGANTAEAYPAQLQDLVGHKVINAGVPGEISEDGLARLPAVLEETAPKLLILCHGGNDFLRKMDEAKTITNLRAMIRLAQSRRIAVLLVATPKPSLLPAPPDFYGELAKEFSLPLENNVLKDILGDNNLKSDLVHPNAAGYRKMAEAVAKLLKKAGAI